MASSISLLERNGFLTLSKFCEYLKEYAPEASVSYPTALKLVGQNKLRARRMGGTYRVYRSEIERWISEGNWERQLTASPYPNT